MTQRSTAVKQWKFVPNKKEDGTPVSIRGKLTFYFEIDNDGKGSRTRSNTVEGSNNRFFLIRRMTIPNPQYRYSGRGDLAFHLVLRP